MNYPKYNIVPTDLWQFHFCWSESSLEAANSTSVLWEKRRGAGNAQSAPSPLPHLILPAHFCHCGVGRVLGQTSFFTDSSSSCPSKHCPVTGMWSLEEVTKHLQWEFKVLLSPLQSFWGHIQDTKVSAGIKIHLEQSLWFSILWKASNTYMQSVL